MQPTDLQENPYGDQSRCTVRYGYRCCLDPNGCSHRPSDASGTFLPHMQEIENRRYRSSWIINPKTGRDFPPYRTHGRWTLAQAIVDGVFLRQAL